MKAHLIHSGTCTACQGGGEQRRQVVGSTHVTAWLLLLCCTLLLNHCCVGLNLQAELPSGSPMIPFLRCMDQLDMDTLSQVLLPKLMQQGSAHSVALTCSRLRDLCCSNVQALKLKAVPGCMPDVAAVKAWGQSLSAHFTSCRSITVGVGCAADCQLTGHLMPALAR